MSVLDAAELALIRQDLQDAACDKDCQIYTKTGVTQDAYGNSSPTYADTPVETKAGMQQPGANLLANYGYRIGSLNSWHVLFPYGTVVGEEDKLVIEGQTLTVHVVLDPHSVPGLTPVLAAAMK